MKNMYLDSQKDPDKKMTRSLLNFKDKWTNNGLKRVKIGGSMPKILISNCNVAEESY